MNYGLSSITQTRFQKNVGLGKYLSTQDNCSYLRKKYYLNRFLGDIHYIFIFVALTYLT